MGIWFERDDEWDDLFKAAGSAHGVDPALLKGLAAAESAFELNAVLWEPSHASTRQLGDRDASRGLLQTTQESADLSGWPEGVDYDDLFDPETSIEYGARELKRYLDDPRRLLKDGSHAGEDARKGNNTADAIAAYNMGFPRAIEHTTPFIAKIYGYPASAPPAGWVYANQPYVDRVLAFAALYRADFSENAKERADAVALLKAKRLHDLAAKYAAPGLGPLAILLTLGGGYLAWRALKFMMKV